MAERTPAEIVREMGHYSDEDDDRSGALLACADAYDREQQRQQCKCVVYEMCDHCMATEDINGCGDAYREQARTQKRAKKGRREVCRCGHQFLEHWNNGVDGKDCSRCRCAAWTPKEASDGER